LRRSGADAILDASPARLDRVLHVDIPIVRVRYRFMQKSGPSIFAIVEQAVTSHGSSGLA
jgi:predicted GTPase